MEKEKSRKWRRCGGKRAGRRKMEGKVEDRADSGLEGIGDIRELEN